MSVTRLRASRAVGGMDAGANSHTSVRLRGAGEHALCTTVLNVPVHPLARACVSVSIDTRDALARRPALPPPPSPSSFPPPPPNLPRPLLTQQSRVGNFGKVRRRERRRRNSGCGPGRGDKPPSRRQGESMAPDGTRQAATHKHDAHTRKASHRWSLPRGEGRGLYRRLRTRDGAGGGGGGMAAPWSLGSGRATHAAVAGCEVGVAWCGGG
jgi:hypothetical protein